MHFMTISLANTDMDCFHNITCTCSLLVAAMQVELPPDHGMVFIDLHRHSRLSQSLGLALFEHRAV